MVEAAIVLPILVLLLMGIIQYGFIFYTYTTGLNISREAARASAISGNTADGDDVAKNLVPPLMQADAPSTVKIVVDAEGRQAMQADVIVKVPLIIPQFLVVASEFTCTTTMRVGG